MMPMFDNQVTIFRFLLVASIVIAFAGAGVDYVLPGVLPPALDEAYEAYSAADELSVPYMLGMGIASLVMLVCGVTVTIGLLLLKSWSRPLALWLSVLSMALYPLLGASVVSGWSTMLTEISSMLWGAALAMAYFADIKVRFAKASA
jgi:urea transporter